MPDPLTREHKFFFEEFQPAAAVALYLGDIDSLQFGGPREGIDCLLTGRSKTVRMEISAAVDGYKDSLQWEHLQEYGSVSVYDRVDFRGSKQQRKLVEQGEGEAYDWEIGLAPELQKLMISTISKKIQKAKSRPLYHDALLLIVIDDHKYAFLNENKLAKLDPLCRCTLAFQEGIDIFSRVLIIGISCKYIFDSKYMRGRLLAS